MDPNWDYLGDLGIGLLSAGGVSTTPRTFGQGLGQAAQFAGQQQIVRQDQAWQNFQRQAAKQKMLADQAAAQKEAEQREAALQQISPQYRNLLTLGASLKDILPLMYPGQVFAPEMPSFEFKDTPKGIVQLDKRGRMPPQITVLSDGTPVVSSASDPSLQRSLEEAKAGGKETGSAQAQAAIDYPRIVDNATTAIGYVDELLKHPGFDPAVGKSSMLQMQKIPGTPAFDFMNRLEQLQGGAFLEAFNSLKGGGQITEVEGKKATQAIQRMNNATSEAEFIAAAEDFKAVLRKGVARARMKSKPIGTMQGRNDDPLGIRQ